MPSRTHNPEKRAWRGRSHKNGGTRVRALREKPAAEHEPHVHEIHRQQRADYPAACKCGALLCPCCGGDSSANPTQAGDDYDDEFFGTVLKGGCTLCTGRPWFEIGEYSDAVTCERLKANGSRR